MLFRRGTFFTMLAMDMTTAANERASREYSQLIAQPVCWRRTRLTRSNRFRVPQFVFLAARDICCRGHRRAAVVPTTQTPMAQAGIMDPLKQDSYLCF